MVSAAILKRDSVLKALRNWRGSTQVQRAQAAGVARGFLSEPASSMKTGSGIGEAGATARRFGGMAR